MRGADVGTVERALRERDPLPGTRGFAGALLDVDDSGSSARGTQSRGGRLVRDVLGRELVYAERGDRSVYHHDPANLDDPDLVPAGHVRSENGDREVWTLPDPEPFANDDVAVERVREAVATSVDGALAPGENPDTAVAFSGGIDSSILAARSDGPLYVAGFDGSPDVETARSAAEALDRDLRVVELTHDDLREAVPEVVRATGRTNAMDVQIALPLYLVARRVADDGFDELAVGQGADELFGGYAKVAKAPDDPRVEADTIRGAVREVVASLPDQLERDHRALRTAGVEPVAPLLHDRVVAAALRLPGHLLVDGEESGAAERPRRKVALRRAADFLPAEIRDRDKKAVQYGSYVARELDRLARQDGFKRRMDDHVTKYVESLL
jgi:asparagine synthase (glutamine-hydrolysing)